MQYTGYRTNIEKRLNLRKRAWCRKIWKAVHGKNEINEMNCI